MDDINYDNDTWNVIDNYFETNTNYLTRHHLDSFNNFIFEKIPQTFSQYNPQIQNEILYHMVESFGVLPHNPFSASLMNPRFDVSVYLASYMNTLFPGSKEIWMSNNSLQAAVSKLLNYKNNF